MGNVHPTDAINRVPTFFRNKLRSGGLSMNNSNIRDKAYFCRSRYNNIQQCITRSYDHIEVNGVHFGVIQSGTTAQHAPVLVLLHGFTGSATSWGTLLDDLAIPGMRIIALDLLGHG